jgi:hypothetical protein
MKLTNYISKIMHKEDKDFFSTLIFIDINDILSEKQINIYLDEIISKNDILQKTIIEKDNKFYLESVTSFDKNHYYSINYCKKELFDNFIDKLLNEKFTTQLKWKFLFCIDKESSKTRGFFKINHEYMDGCKMIEILTPFQNYDITKTFKRKTTFFNSLYYYFIGTIILIIMNIKVFIKVLFSSINQNHNHDNYDDKKTDFIIFKKLNLNNIKKYTIKNNITINIFLFSLMVKTDKYYRKKNKELLIISPINTGKKDTLNVSPIFNSIDNYSNTNKLFNKLNNTFNNFKYSLFIPIFDFLTNFITQYIELDMLTKVYYNFINNTDYIYSNIVGISNLSFCKNKNFEISNLRFLTNAVNKEIMYNIVSSGNNLNIVCSFKEGIIKNKKKFKKSFYKAYNKLLNN